MLVRVEWREVGGAFDGVALAVKRDFNNCIHASTSTTENDKPKNTL